MRYAYHSDVVLHSVELSDGVSTVRTAVDDVLAPIHTERDQTTSQPQPAGRKRSYYQSALITETISFI